MHFLSLFSTAILLLGLTAAVPINTYNTIAARNAQDDAAMFTAEMADQNEMQQQTTEQESAQNMNDAAWRTASSAASDQIQKRQDPTQDYQDAQADMFTAEMQAQNEMQQQTTEEEFAQKMNDAAWKTASSAASDKIQKRQDSIEDVNQDYMDAQSQMFTTEMQQQNEMQQQTTSTNAGDKVQR